MRETIILIARQRYTKAIVFILIRSKGIAKQYFKVLKTTKILTDDVKSESTPISSGEYSFAIIGIDKKPISLPMLFPNNNVQIDLKIELFFCFTIATALGYRVPEHH